MTGRQERAADRRCASYKEGQSVSSVLPQLLRANMDCGVVISKTVLLFLSLVFWVREKIENLISAKLLKLPSEVTKCCVAIVAQALPGF